MKMIVKSNLFVNKKEFCRQSVWYYIVSRGRELNTCNILWLFHNARYSVCLLQYRRYSQCLNRHTCNHNQSTATTNEIAIYRSQLWGCGFVSRPRRQSFYSILIVSFSPIEIQYCVRREVPEAIDKEKLAQEKADWLARRQAHTKVRASALLWRLNQIKCPISILHFSYRPINAGLIFTGTTLIHYQQTPMVIAYFVLHV